MTDDYEYQQQEWKKYTLECNAKGICEYSGYTFKECIPVVCDCGWEYLPDDQIDFEVNKLVEHAKLLLEGE